MRSATVGIVMTAAIALGVGLILLINREPARAPAAVAPVKAPKLVDAAPGGVPEHPIGDDVVKNHMTIAAVWLPHVGMAGMPEPSSDLIHLEADVRATANNPNGFAKDEFVPYMKVRYEVADAKGGPSIQSGDLTPMVASDGFHYGANVAKPAPGSYRLTFRLEPPSAGGLGRHADAATGVAEWWAPFAVGFDWTVEADKPQAVAAAR